MGLPYCWSRRRFKRINYRQRKKNKRDDLEDKDDPINEQQPFFLIYNRYISLYKNIRGKGVKKNHFFLDIQRLKI